MVGLYVLVSLLIIDITVLGPALGLVAHDLVNTGLLIGGIIVDAAEMIPVVLQVAVLLASARKVKPNPGFDLILVADLFGAVVRVDFNNLALLLAIRGETVIQDRIEVDANATVLGRLAHLHQLVFGAPFGGDAALLVKLAEIIQVIDVVAIPVR